ncbi:hypothetical protein FSARC_1613 [Fusarium sarcochroum]|uniref:Heterokaryon incompatibility domain-containing protein n=1 Tax=Fusarium sarcochroum TaxID=1208366 RepID=A0A8H4XEY6_9HYPO|nr:hypothetical protein FSARC_1613 [Fusarium sarcochroum]
MPISSLPPTFRDASFAARNLGVRYIWIDALCIFQDKDDLSDWNREASLMHKVYSNSFCNIVAGVNKDSSQSIFASRDRSSLISPASVARLEKTSFLSNNVGSLEGHATHEYIVTHRQFWDQVNEAHINTRGWVVQERFMSHRALHFGNQQLFWECREMEACETNPDGLRSKVSAVPFPAHNVDKQPKNRGYPNRYAFWDDLVEIYSACALSFPSDKLVALSGIAKHVAEVFPDDYVAGMWRRRLEYNLLWYVDVNSESSRYDTYVAPSWSWASIKGKVVAKLLSDRNTDLLYRLDDYKLEYATSDETGAILGGWLRLRGSLRRLKLLRRENGRTRWDTWSMVIDDVEDEWRKSKRNWNPWMVKLDDPQGSYNEENESGALYCMPAEDYPSRPGHNFLTLFLLQVVDSSRGTFRRIGVATGDRGYIGHMLEPGESDWGKSPPSSELDGSGQTAIPCAAYNDGVYSIFVI